jgi:hypothetical protein
MQSRIRLFSGRVPVTDAANVASERYQFLDLPSAEPNLGVANNSGYLLIYDTVSPGQRKWVNSIGSQEIPFESVIANTLVGLVDGGTFI